VVGLAEYLFFCRPRRGERVISKHPPSHLGFFIAFETILFVKSNSNSNSVATREYSALYCASCSSVLWRGGWAYPAEWKTQQY